MKAPDAPPETRARVLNPARKRGPLAERIAKAQNSKRNKMVQALRYMPEDLKAKWGVQFEKPAEDAFYALLTGAPLECPHCHKLCGHYARDPHPQALRFFGEIKGMVGPEHQFVLNLTQRLGVEASQLEPTVEAGKRMLRLQADASASHERLFEEGLQLVWELLVAHPEWRPRALARVTQ